MVRRLALKYNVFILSLYNQEYNVRWSTFISGPRLLGYCKLIQVLWNFVPPFPVSAEYVYLLGVTA